MSKWGWMIGVLCFLASAIMLLWSREQTRKTVRKIEKMLDDAMNGSFTETDFDESELSALETKFANYLLRQRCPHKISRPRRKESRR